VLPDITWEFKEMGDRVYLRIVTHSSANKASVWMTTSAGKDFRQSRWTLKPMSEINNNLTGGNGRDPSSKIFEIEIQNPLKGFMAIYGEVEFIQDGSSFLLSTQTYISNRK
jgi:hypothetical protein